MNLPRIVRPSPALIAFLCLMIGSVQWITWKWYKELILLVIGLVNLWQVRKQKQNLNITGSTCIEYRLFKLFWELQFCFFIYIYWIYLTTEKISVTPTLIEGKKTPNHHPFITCFCFEHVRKNWGKEIGKTCQNDKNKKKIIIVPFWSYCRKFNFWSMPRLVHSGNIYQDITLAPQCTGINTDLANNDQK